MFQIPIPIPILCICTAEMIRGRQAVSRFATHETGPMLRNLTLPPPSIQTQHGFSLVNTKYWILLDMFFRHSSTFTGDLNLILIVQTVAHPDPL